ncbi:MAG: hypothetical protein AB7P02_19565 [Alphaproteobacteria bacterium]
MRRFLIDRRGSVSPVERGVRTFVHERLPSGADIVTYAVRELGVIEVAFAPFGARIRLRPRATNQRAISTALYMLLREAPSRILLAHCDRSWSEEIVPSFAMLVTRLEELVSGVRSRYPEKPFHSEELPIDPREAIIPQSFATLLEQWHQRRGVLPDDPTRPFRHAACLGRTSMVSVRSDSRLVVAFRGRGLTHYGRAGWTDSIGRTVDEQPDAGYALSASRSYGLVAAMMVPRLESCEASIAGRNGNGRRSVYDRLLLPWRTADGAIVISGLSRLRGRVPWRNATKPAESSSSSASDIQTQEMSDALP